MVLWCVKFLKYSICRHYSNRNVIRLKERGMFQDLFPDNSAGNITDLLNSRPQCVYAGFDPTSNSLHVGNLLILINLLHWQRGGHNVIALIGGATAKIGDPSGRITERNELNAAAINGNIEGLRSNIEQIFSNHERYFWPNRNPLPPIRILNNEEWYKGMTPVQLIGGAGRHLRMGTLLSRTSVATRLASPAGMSFTEFSYQLFQAYDWLHVFKKFDCRFQIGGNDQMGNLMSGHELISKLHKTPVYGLTMPLITSEIGDKFGKSAGNAVWLSRHQSSPFTFYQFFIRTPDSEVERLLKLFTFDSTPAIAALMKQHLEQPDLRRAQRRLAEQATLLVHGEDGLDQAKLVTSALFEGTPEALGKINAEQIGQAFQGATIVDLLPEAGINILDMAMKVGCFPTKDDALRIISAGGFYINQQRANNPNEILNPSVHRLANNVTLLRVGKRNHYVVKWHS